MMELTHLSLFSGIGGLDLAAEAAGFATVGQCEFADYPTKVLEKHWPDVPRWKDIRTLNGESFYAKTGRRTVDLISGGFPCQPFSVAGNQKGKDDERYLWPEMLRVIRELTPRWVVCENVPGIMRIAAGDVVESLERAGYDVAVFNFEAAAVGALHRRARVAFVANAMCERLRQPQLLCDTGSNSETIRQWETGEAFRSGKVPGAMADTNGEGLQRFQQYGAFDAARKTPSKATGECSKTMADSCCLRLQRNTRREHAWESAHGYARLWRNWWAAEPPLGRVANGVPNRMDRIRCLGNAVVPAQFYPIFAAIAEVERIQI